MEFGRFQPWLRPVVKAFISWGWLAQNYSVGWCRTTLVSLRFLNEYLRVYKPDVDQVTKLQVQVAEGFSVYLKEQTSIQTAYKHATTVGMFARWYRRQYKVPVPFRPQLLLPKPVHKRKSKEARAERVIPLEVTEQLARAVGKRHAELWADWTSKPPSKRPKGPELLYLQVLKIMLACPLRISQILLLGRNCLRESQGDEEPGVWVRYQESKTHQGEQEKYVPEEFAPMVRDAVTVALSITGDLAKKTDSDLLFLTDRVGGAQGGGNVRNHSLEAFNLWLNGRQNPDGLVKRPGFIHRHNIRFGDEYYWIDPHQSRHTLATQVYLGGGGFGTVTEYLHHRSQNMTDVYVHGEERLVEEVTKALDHGTLVGKAAPLIQDREVMLTEITDEDLAYYKASGLFLQLTPYGACVRPKQYGPCPYPHPCWRGPKNDPCNYSLLLPRGLDAMEKDMEILDRQLAIWEREEPESNFVANVRATRQYYRRLRSLLEQNGTDASTTHPRPAAEPGRDTPVVSPTMVQRRKRTRRTVRSRTSVLPPRRSEGVKNGRTTAQRVMDLVAELERTNATLPVSKFALQCELADSHFRTRFPDIVQWLQERQGHCLNWDKAQLLMRLEHEWEGMLSRGEVLTVIDFAAHCGLHRDVIYHHFPEFARQVHRRWKQAMDRRKSELLDARNGRSRKERRAARLTKMAETWRKVLSEGQPISIAEFSRRVGLDDSIIHRDYPEWLTTIANWNDGRKPKANRDKLDQAVAQRRMRLEMRFEEEFAKVLASEEKVDLREFSRRCGVDRNVFYKEFPDWVERIQANHFGGDQLREKLERIVQEAESTASTLTISGFAQVGGVRRNVLYNRFPDLVARVKALKEK